MSMKINWDSLGITASLACAIHCAVLPILITSLPVFGIDIIHNVYFEYTMIALAALIGIKALGHGYKNHHHKIGPIILFVIGIILLILKEALGHSHAHADCTESGHHHKENLHIYYLVPAVCCIIIAHYLNYKYSAAMGKCGDSHCSHQH